MEIRPYKAKRLDNGESIIGFPIRTDKGTYILPDLAREIRTSTILVDLPQLTAVDPESLRIFVCEDCDGYSVFVGDMCKDSANPNNIFTIGYEQFSHSHGEVSADKTVWELYIRNRLQLAEG